MYKELWIAILKYSSWTLYDIFIAKSRKQNEVNMI